MWPVPFWSDAKKSTHIEKMPKKKISRTNYINSTVKTTPVTQK
jgi:hypothetical protein